MAFLLIGKSFFEETICLLRIYFILCAFLLFLCGFILWVNFLYETKGGLLL